MIVWKSFPDTVSWENMRYQLTHSFIRVSGPTRNTALSDRNPATYNTVCSLHVALPAPHSTVCSAPFRTSYYLTKAYARRAIYRLQAGASVSVFPIFAHIAVWQHYARTIRLQTLLKRMYWPKPPLPQHLLGAFKEIRAPTYRSVCNAHYFYISL